MKDIEKVKEISEETLRQMSMSDLGILLSAGIKGEYRNKVTMIYLSKKSKVI